MLRNLIELYYHFLIFRCCWDTTNNCTIFSTLFLKILYKLGKSTSNHTVRKKDLILRSIERRPQMQFSIARKFPLWRLRRYSVMHSKMRNFTFDALWPEKLKNTGWARTSTLWICSLPLWHCATHAWGVEEFFTYIYFFFARFHCLRNIPRQCRQNARKWIALYAA